MALRFEHHLNSSPALKMAVTSPYGAKDESPAVVERFEDTSDVHLGIVCFGKRTRVSNMPGSRASHPSARGGFAAT